MTDHRGQAKRLHLALKQLGYEVRLGHAYEGVAALHNVPNWNTLSARPHQRPLSGHAAQTALMDTLQRLAGIQVSLEEVEQLVLATWDGHFVWSPEAEAVVRFVLLTARSLTSDGLSRALDRIEQWVSDDTCPLRWQPSANGVPFLTAGEARGLPEPLECLLRQDWATIRALNDVAALRDEVITGLAFGFALPLHVAALSPDEQLRAHAVLAGYRRGFLPLEDLYDEMMALPLDALGAEGLSTLPRPALDFLMNPLHRLRWSEIRAAYPRREGLVDLTGAVKLGILHRLLTPLPAWEGRYTDILISLLNREEMHTTVEEVMARTHELGFRDSDASDYPGLTQRQLIAAGEALRVKLEHPEVPSPRHLVVVVTELDFDTVHGLVLYAPERRFRRGAAFEESYAFIPADPKFQHQERTEFIYESGGRVIHSRTIRHGEQGLLPQRRVGEIVTFQLP